MNCSIKQAIKQPVRQLSKASLKLAAKVILLTQLLFISINVVAVEEIRQFDNAEQESLYQKLIIELRCLVCQNQNIADSNAELAQDLRSKTYELIQQDKNESEIKS